MRVLVIGLNFRTASVEQREKFAFAEEKIPQALARLRESGTAAEAAILSTCNRVELYVAAEAPRDDAFEALRSFLLDWHGQNGGPAPDFYTHDEPESLEHLFKVASGLDSMVLGETEILGQLKKAYDGAFQAGYTGARLNKAFQRAFNVAKHIRTETNIQRGSISVASVSVELSEKIFSSLEGRKVMVIGAGDTSEKAARAMLSRGAAQVNVTNRSFERAEALAAALNGKAIPFDQWEGEFPTTDILISCTAAPNYVLDRKKLEPLMPSRRGRPLVLIDIAVPRDIDPLVNDMENVYLYNIDDLQEIASDYLARRQEEVGRCEQIIREKVRALLTSPNSRPAS
jgi:glutamyl-tRNA reductase